MTTEPKIAQTWEECARHVEAGGVVAGTGKGGALLDDGMTAVDYRKRAGAPGNGGWLHRRLLPIEDANPEGMTPGPEVDGRPTWYGTARDAEVAGMTEGRCWTKYAWTHVGDWDAAAIVQARYPLPPKPKTVRVHWSVAVGRTDPHGREIVTVQKVAGWKPQVRFVGCGWLEVSSPDGTVEVLAEDGES
jgi:hypothetical protein